MSSYVHLSLKILEVICARHWLCVPLNVKCDFLFLLVKICRTSGIFTGILT